MDRIYASGAAGSAPSVPASPSSGYPTAGNPGTGTPATKPGPYWYHMVMEELMNVISSAGITPAAGTLTQLKQALDAIYGGKSPVGTIRNGKMTVAAASASATFTADEVVVETALGGTAYRLSGFNKTVNLAATGVGGMDTGSAPVSGYVALYAIYNPTTQASALLAVNATAAAVPEVHGGANMPAGYTASALVSVWATNASSQFKIGYQRDRNVFFPSVTALASSTVAGSLTSLNIAAAVPKNAVAWSGSAIMVSTSTSSVAMSISADANNTGSEYFNGSAVPGGAVSAPISTVPIITAQTTYYTNSNTAGTPTFTIYVNGYTF